MDGRSNLNRYRTSQSQAAAPSSSNATILNSSQLASPPVQSARVAETRPAAGQSTTSSTNSRTNVPKMPTAHPRAVASPLTPVAQSPMTSPSQSTLLQLLAVIQDQQSVILTHVANSDRTLCDLVADVGKLKQNEEDAKAREARGRAMEERDQEYFKALQLLAQRVDDVRKSVVGIETVVGVGRQVDGGKTVLDKLQNIEMDMEECLERMRDPDAGAVPIDRHASIQPPTPLSLSPTFPTVIRHEMAVSPVKALFTSRAVSTTAPESRSAPESTKIDVSTQVDTSDEPSTQLNVIRGVPKFGPVCVSCSTILTSLRSPIKRVSTILNDINTGNSSGSSLSKMKKGKEVERSFVRDGASHQISNDHPFISHPLAESSPANMVVDLPPPPLYNPSPATHSNLEASKIQSACKHPESPFKSGSKESSSAKQAIASFSPVDWTKARSSSSAASASLGATLPSTITSSSRGNSYKLPALPEGTVAALRKEALVDPHPYPLDSTTLGDRNSLPSTFGVVGAGVEAAERMLSPESQCAGEDDLFERLKSPEVCEDIRRSESIQPISLSAGLATSQSNAQSVAQNAEKSKTAQSTQTKKLPLLRDQSTESSLTSLTTLSSISLSNMEDSIHDGSGPPPEQDNMMVMDVPPVSLFPASPSPTTLSQVLRAASPVALAATPNLKKAELVASPENDDLGNESLTKLQEWYREQGTKTSNPQVEIANPADLATNQNDDLGKDDSNAHPPSPLFTAPSDTPPDVSLSSSDGHSLVQPASTLYLEKLVNNLQDDDVDVVPVPTKQKRKSSTMESMVGSADSLMGSKKGPIPPTSSSNPRKRSLLAVQKNDKTSKAKTRIKKRKVSQEPMRAEMDSEDEEDQPPLKRVKLRKQVPSSRDGKIPQTAKLRSAGIVTPTKRLPRTATLVWPKIDNPVFDQFIECDSCDRWYHLGCVGVQPDDIRLSASEIYQCPLCEAGISLEGTPIRVTKGGKDDSACARPKCLCPRRTQSVKKREAFVVESFVGMLKKVVGGRGLKFSYLVKWLGYGFEEATWEEEHTMGLPNPAFIIEKFEREARREGLDLTECNSQALLLKCAIEAGWNSNGQFIKKEV